MRQTSDNVMISTQLAMANIEVKYNKKNMCCCIFHALGSWLAHKNPVNNAINTVKRNSRLIQ